MTAEEMTALEKQRSLAKKFDDAMDDDFNTADAISVVFELVRLANSNVNAKNSTKAFVQNLWMNFWSLAISGTCFRDQRRDPGRRHRETDRGASGGKKREKTFQRADEIRAELLEKGIVLKGYKRRSKMEKSIEFF